MNRPPVDFVDFVLRWVVPFLSSQICPDLFGVYSKDVSEWVRD